MLSLQGVQYRVCRVITTGCSMLQVPVLLPGVRGPLAAAALLAGVAAGHAAVQPHGQCAQVPALPSDSSFVVLTTLSLETWT